ncbi:MAG: hypothetical protein IIB21_04245 [Chloroflexi bacterium]|nr:hypothetical protein [Chloroflexota bacterium]
MVAKSRKAQENLLAAFKDRRISKYYRAVIRGVPRARKPRVIAPVGRLSGSRSVVVTQFGKEAETGFTVLEAGRGCALVEARPLTGRTHQIRVHLASIGHPIVGDPVYGRKRRGAVAVARQFLHAHRLVFQHPRTGERLELEAPLPEDLEKALAELETD